MNDKWNVHELHNMLVQEETMNKNQGSHSGHYVSHQRNQGVSVGSSGLIIIKKGGG